jgi:aminopeptidase-like protein
MRVQSKTVGEEIFHFLERLWPYCRSITGEGLRMTLHDIRDLLPGLNVLEVPSGSQALDWVVPDEWNIRDAWIKDSKGRKVVDFTSNNIHILGYSEPYHGWVDRDKLLDRIYTLENQPGSIPYVTSYYKRRWGFCMAHDSLGGLTDDRYEVMIDSTLAPGSLSIGEYILPGKTSEEVLFSTYCCHPSLANDQLSGIGLSVFLALWLSSLPSRRFSYRFVFLPEIIGSAAYLERHQEHLKKHTVAAFNLTCVGDDRCWSYLPSRKGDTLSDKAVLNLLRFHTKGFSTYSWNQRGSDESMFCAPGIDLPMTSLMRSKYGTFPEYHTSADRLGVTVTAKGLQESFEMYNRLVIALERNGRPAVKVLGEPQLGKRGLYPDLSIKGSTDSVKDLLNVLSYCDSENDLFDISDMAGVPVDKVIGYLDKFLEHGLIGDWDPVK